MDLMLEGVRAMSLATIAKQRILYSSMAKWSASSWDNASLEEY